MFRWVLGVAVLVAYGQMLLDYEMYFGRMGMCPRIEWHLIRPERTLSYFQFIQNEAACKAIAVAAVVPMVTFWWGIYPRISALASWYFVVSLHDRCPLILDGSDFVIRLMLFLFIFARADRRLSPVAPVAKADPGDSFPIRLMQVQLCLIYITTGLQKLYGSKWTGGTALAYTMQLDSFSRANWSFLAENAVFVNTATYMTLFFEISFIYFVWPKKTRPFILALGVAMHAGIEVIMYVPMFSWVMVSTYLVFFEPSWAVRTVDAIMTPYARWARNRRYEAVANGELGVLLRQLDVLNAVRWQEPSSAQADGLSLSKLGAPTAMRGFGAWSRLALCVPSLLVWLPVLALPNGVRAMERGFARAAR